MLTTTQVDRETLDILRVNCIDFDDTPPPSSDSIPGVPIADEPATTAALPTELLTELRNWADPAETQSAPRAPKRAESDQPLARSVMSPSVERMLRDYLELDEDDVTRVPPAPSTRSVDRAGSGVARVSTRPTSPPGVMGSAAVGHARDRGPWFHRDIVESRLRVLEERGEVATWAKLRQVLGLDWSR